VWVRCIHITLAGSEYEFRAILTVDESGMCSARDVHCEMKRGITYRPAGSYKKIPLRRFLQELLSKILQ
jgi:hypothetical protein